MPDLVPAVLARLIARVREGAGAAVLGPPDAAMWVAPLPAAVSRDAARTEIAAALAEGERSLRAALARLHPAIVPAGEWRVDDPEARTLRDIDRPADLA
jgi:molybdopterin-guanine dinucleotide biosynthesis protein A